MDSENSSKRPRYNNNNNHRGHRGGRGNRGHRRGRGRGDSNRPSKTEYKMVQKGQFRDHLADRNYHVVTNSKGDIFKSVDLKSTAIVEYVGEIFFKESFLEDPWRELNNNNDELIDEVGDEAENKEV